MNYEEMKTGEKNTFNTAVPMEKDEASQKPTYVTIDVRSGLFKVIAFVCAAVGVVLGVVLGFAFPLSVIDTSYTFLDVTDEVFNWVLMLGTWVLFAVTAVGFWALYCHLANQEETIKELKILNSKIKSE